TGDAGESGVRSRESGRFWGAECQMASTASVREPLDFSQRPRGEVAIESKSIDRGCPSSAGDRDPREVTQRWGGAGAQRSFDLGRTAVGTDQRGRFKIQLSMFKTAFLEAAGS